MSGDVMDDILSAAQHRRSQLSQVNRRSKLEHLEEMKTIVEPRDAVDNLDEKTRGNGDQDGFKADNDLSIVDIERNGKGLPADMINKVEEIGNTAYLVDSKRTVNKVNMNSHIKKLIDVNELIKSGIQKDLNSDHVEKIRINKSIRTKTIVEMKQRSNERIQQKGLFWLEDICITGMLFTGNLRHHNKFMVDAKVFCLPKTIKSLIA